MSSLSFASSSVQAQLDAANEEIAKLRNEVARHRDTSMNQSDTIRTLRENINNLADNVDELAAENGMLHARVHQLEGADQATVAASGDNTTSAPDGIDIDINTASAFSSLAIQPKQR
jgi:chromosome segregation ATPase